MVNIELLEPLKELLLKENVQGVEVMEELGRIFFSNAAVTINLVPALLVGAGLLLFLLPLLGVPILDILFGAMTGATGGYGNAYGGSVSAYGAAPVNDYGYASRSGVELSPEQEALFPKLSELRGQIEELQESESKLRNHIYQQVANSEAADPYSY